MIHTFGEYQAYVTVVSASRPDNVQPMEKLLDLKPTWVVPEWQARKYVANGAVVNPNGSRFSVNIARNEALRRAFQYGVPCVQIDDDLKRVQLATARNEKHDFTMREALSLMIERVYDSPYRLCGIAPTANAGFYNPERQMSPNLFVIGSCMVILPNQLVFDETLRLKGDYDYTCKHIELYGGALRCNDLLMTFQHYTNEGGCEFYRTDKENEACRQILLKRWPQYLKPHPRREGEMLLRAKLPTRVTL